MILNIIFLVAGLALILYGANTLTDGASSIAKRFGISDLVIGLTVVAFGTSMPELVISMVSAMKGSTEMAIGNVVGSNIFNILVIIGVTAAVRPIKIERNIMTNEIPLVILSSIVLLIMANAPILDGTPEAAVTRVDGLLLLLFFAIFMRYTFATAKRSIDTDPMAGQVTEKAPMKMWKASLFVIIGLACLVFGGDRFVAGASYIAAAMGVSDAVIGLTIVAAGTSLPELATSVAAALKGKPGIALGNVIGSNIFNIFFVLGTTASIHQLPLGRISNFDMMTLVGASLLFWFFGWFFKVRTITRGEGVALIIIYVAYTVKLIVG